MAKQNTNLSKEPSKFQHGYMQNASQPQHGNPSSMYINTVKQQHLQHNKPPQPNDMAKYASGRIPFADAPNPPAGPAQGSLVQLAQQHKTPVRPINTPAAKSSPHFPPSESIALPEIATDSEDEDSDNEFQAPAWANSPALRELLAGQQLVDPETVFGPIAPLQMEEVFKNSKDKLKKFRDRTSSANWNGADRLTEEERKKDRKAREQMMVDGGWDYKNQNAAS